MPKIVECPYCKGDVAITNDDCHEEGKIYAQECRGCEGVFTFMVRYEACFTPFTADCLNGAPHNFIQITRNTKACRVCQREEDL